ncbi:uncharacterized protein EV420DRAFT_652444 [Desarmillaria tabescens]|uniref:Uncharacterized protein n=1 Tax=Armillaria tabescens TaxID=1929756 RepID=A0AA39NJN6_ARMTA|nr:uncharacterized protein EV420DRAFT_652444 [Desarmillaria tabescens]KAK0466870.1 hypothetical protein EV420DRAFT_652444 [Desarmillaria tabescens]
MKARPLGLGIFFPLFRRVEYRGGVLSFQMHRWCLGIASAESFSPSGRHHMDPQRDSVLPTDLERRRVDANLTESICWYLVGEIPKRTQFLLPDSPRSKGRGRYPSSVYMPPLFGQLFLTQYKHDYQQPTYPNYRLSLCHRDCDGIICHGLRKGHPRSYGISRTIYCRAGISSHCCYGQSRSCYLTIFDIIRLYLGPSVVGML